MTADAEEGPWMPRATITGWGRCTSDEWITTRSGIKERRICHVSNSDMASVAGAHAIAAAGLDPADIDYLILATCTPDRQIPSAASYVQAKVGLVNAAAIDVNAACTGFIYGLNLADGLIAGGTAERILLIGSEKISAYLDTSERSTTVLFGDGAGAVVVEPSTGDEGVLSTNLGSDGNLAEILSSEGLGTDYIGTDVPMRIIMDGREVFRNAVTQMGKAATKAVTDAGLELEDVDLLIPHQANVRIIDATARRLGLREGQVYTNIASYGNTSAASIPIALSEAMEQGRIAFGGGLTWGAMALKWGDRVEPLGSSDAELPPSDKTGLELLLEQQEAKAR
jgi:3-oxoacyl-[acyl-carrier-protein] synthase-3